MTGPQRGSLRSDLPGAALDSCREQREAMVSDQIEARGIRDPRVLQAMRDLPRHTFVPEQLAHLAYEDRPLPIGQSQTISQPYMVALMTELLALTGTERVLEIGTGSGYQAIILARLAKEVVTVERIPELSARSRELAESLRVTNITFIVSDGTLGHPAGAPYDRILVTAGAPHVPGCLIEQLSEGGILEIPVGAGEQVLKVITKIQGQVRIEDNVACVFVPLLGAQGFRSDPDGP